jgi:hypothetical protein
MQGVFSGEATTPMNGHQELLAEFLPDGRFAGDSGVPDGYIRLQGYWRLGAIDPKRGCTIVEGRQQRGEWFEAYCASIERDGRTALNCDSIGGDRSCLMVRKPRTVKTSAINLGGSIPAR